MTSTQVLFGYPLPESPWALVLGVYFILTGMASGIALLWWWLRPREPKAADGFEWTAGVIAMAAMIIALAILVLDLGRPARFFLMLTEFDNPGSIMSFGAKLVAAKTFFLGVYLYLNYRRRHGLPDSDKPVPAAVSHAIDNAVSALLGITSLGLAVYPAFLLSRTWSSPLASSPGSGLLFLSTALLLGVAVATMLVMVAPDKAVDEEFRARLRRTLLLLVAAQAVFLVFQGLSSIGSRPELAHAFRQLVAGDSAMTFWSLVVVAGIALPLQALLALPRHRLAVLIAAAGALVGAGATRYLFFTVH